MKNLMSDFSFSTIFAGIIALLVGYTSSAVIVYQAAIAAGASTVVASSWLGVLCVSMGALTIFLSLKYKTPIMFAWSTAGAALLYTSVNGIPMEEIIGAFIFSASLILLSGLSGYFEKVMKRIPVGIASAMLAGVLLHFAFEVFISMKTQMFLAMSLFLVYLIGRRFFQRFNIVVVFCIGMMIAWLQNLLHFPPVDFAVLNPVFVSPRFSIQAIISIGVPLFFVTMSSQNLTGVAVLRAFNYHPPISKLISWSGLTNLLVAPFGGFTLNLSALTAAMCMGIEAHPDEKKRYTAAVSSGVLYIVVGLFSGAVVSVLTAFPRELIMSIAGLALISTISNGIVSAVQHEADREASLMTFFVTASGVSLWGVGAAFWGLVAGTLVSITLKYKKN